MVEIRNKLTKKYMRLKNPFIITPILLALLWVLSLTQNDYIYNDKSHVNDLGEQESVEDTAENWDETVYLDEQDIQFEEVATNPFNTEFLSDIELLFASEDEYFFDNECFSGWNSEKYLITDILEQSNPENFSYSNFAINSEWLQTDLKPILAPTGLILKLSAKIVPLAASKLSLVNPQLSSQSTRSPPIA